MARRLGSARAWNTRSSPATVCACTIYKSRLIGRQDGGMRGRQPAREEARRRGVRCRASRDRETHGRSGRAARGPQPFAELHVARDAVALDVAEPLDDRVEPPRPRGLVQPDDATCTDSSTAREHRHVGSSRWDPLELLGGDRGMLAIAAALRFTVSYSSVISA